MQCPPKQCCKRYSACKSGTQGRQNKNLLNLQGRKERICTLQVGHKNGADVPIKENDHSMDDIRYFTASISTGKKGFSVFALRR